MRGIPVLMYHGLQENGRPFPGDARYTLEAEVFESQMRYLAQNGFQTVLPSQATQKEYGRRHLAITFDDGTASDCSIALPILRRYGFRAEFFITTAWIGTPGFLTEKQLRRLKEAGMDLGSHGVSHRYLNDLGPEDLCNELRSSRQRLMDITDAPVEGISFPGGRAPQDMSAVFDAGYRYCCGSRVALWRPSDHHGPIPRIAVFRHTPLDTFACIVSGRAHFFIPAALRYFTTESCRRALGNRGYEKFREALLKHTGKALHS